MVDTAVVESPTILTPPEKPADPKAEEVLFKGSPTEPAKPAEPAKPTDQGKPGEPVKKEEPKKEDPKPDAAKPGEPKPTEPEKKPGQEPAKPTPTDIDLKVPEGSLLSKEEVAAFAKEAKEAGLTKEQAEAELNKRDTTLKAYETRRVEAEKATLEKTSNEWRAACEKDPVIGGVNFAENIVLAERGFKAVADLELQQLAAATGFGNHPAVVRAFMKLGRMMADDKLIRGTVGAPQAEKTAAEKLYGATTPAA